MTTDIQLTTFHRSYISNCKESLQELLRTSTGCKLCNLKGLVSNRNELEEIIMAAPRYSLPSNHIHSSGIVSYRSQQIFDGEEKGHSKGTVRLLKAIIKRYGAAANFRVHVFVAFTHVRHHSKASTALSMQDILKFSFKNQQSTRLLV